MNKVIHCTGGNISVILNELSFEKRKGLYYEILKVFFLKKECFIFTIEPQKYSFFSGYLNEEYFFDGLVKVLINKVVCVDSKLLFEISQSEEFCRGLIKILTHQNCKNPNHYIAKISSKSFLLHDCDLLIQSENDGNEILIFNGEKFGVEVDCLLNSIL